MDYTRHTPLLFLPWQLAQHSSRAYPLEQLLWAPQAQWWATSSHWHSYEITGGVGSLCCPRTASALGQQQWLQTDAVTTQLTHATGSMGQSPFQQSLASQGFQIWASDPRNLLGRAQLLYAFLHKQQWNLHWYISASYPGWPMFVMPSKLNFWLLKAFLKSPSEFSDRIFHYLIKAMIVAKECLECQKAWDAHGECQHAAGTGSSHELWDSLST